MSRYDARENVTDGPIVMSFTRRGPSFYFSSNAVVCLNDTLEDTIVLTSVDRLRRRRF